MKSKTLNQTWKPNIWIAVILGFFLQPLIFLYLQRPILFWIYLIVGLVIHTVGTSYDIPLDIIYAAVCAIHAYLIAKNARETAYRKWYSHWWGILASCMIFFITAFVIRSFFYEPFSVGASSMSPSLSSKDVAIVQKYGYGDYGTYNLLLFDTDVSDSFEPERGEIYTFRPPYIDNNIVYVKRLIAKPGDTVDIDGDVIKINGHPLKTTLVSENNGVSIYEETSDDVTYQIKRSESEIEYPQVHLTVPEDHYFFLGDNRNFSQDSRIWGTVPSDRFVGKVVYVFGK